MRGSLLLLVARWRRDWAMFVCFASIGERSVGAVTERCVLRRTPETPKSEGAGRGEDRLVIQDTWSRDMDCIAGQQSCHQMPVPWRTRPVMSTQVSLG
jgi:hypothetical protein